MYCGAAADDLYERDHELRASLCGIEAVALVLKEQRDRMPGGDVDELAEAIASEARRLRLMLAPHAKQRTIFDLAEAIGPAILMTRSLGVVVRDEVPRRIWVQGCRDDFAQAVLAILDNARVHAAPSPVDVRVTSFDGSTTLYVEDRGPGLDDGGQPLFNRGRRGARSMGSGLGLFVARRLVVDQGGSLTVEARPGGGASFALSLATAPSSMSEAAAQAARAAPQLAVVR